MEFFDAVNVGSCAAGLVRAGSQEPLTTLKAHSIAGRVLSGSLEQWRQVAPTSAVAGVRRIAPVGCEPLEPRAASDVPTPPSATGAAHSGVLAAYAAAASAGCAAAGSRVAVEMSSMKFPASQRGVQLQQNPLRSIGCQR